MDYDEKKQQRIIRNIEEIFQNNDIDRLTKDSYDFLNVYAGFIAHYDINGFKSVYDDLCAFANELGSSDNLGFADELEKREEFNESGDKGYDKANILRNITKIAQKYKPQACQKQYEREREDAKREVDYLKRKYNF